jgi:hypothetical protein
MHFIRSRYGYLTGILGLLTLLGCGSSSKHSADAYASFAWNIYALGSTASLTCGDVGADTVEVTSIDQATHDQYVDSFACAKYQDYTAYLPSGNYEITVRLYDKKSGILLYDTSSSQTLFSGSNTLPVVNFWVNSFVLGWSITSNGVGTTCAAVGASWVALDVYYSPSQTVATTYYLPCDDSIEYVAATEPIPAGPYAVTWQAFLLDNNDRELTFGTQLMSYNVSYSAQADLGDVHFAF